MNGFLKGKRALVTGGSKGIGLAIAQALSASGADTVICARDGAALETALQKLRGSQSAKVAGTVADVGQSASVARMFQFIDRELGGLDILVNNAGIGVFHATAEMSVEEWDRVIGVNLSGAFYCSREALTRFAQGRGGHIVNVSSLAGKNPFAGGAAYNASKFGLNGFSEAAMLDHRYDNVRVSYVMPGSVATEFSGHPPGAEDQDWKIAPEDIAEVVLTILRMPERTVVSRIEMRPSRPRKN